MADFEIKRGDTAPSLMAVLKDRTGAPVNLATATGVLFVMRGATGATNSTPKIAAACTVTADQNANTGQVTYDWQAADTASAGSFLAEFVVTWGSGKEQTFPTSGFLTITIYDDLEAHAFSMAATAPGTPLRVVMDSDAEAKATIARKTAATTAPVLSDADLDELVKYAKRPNGGYNTNRAAAEGWRWKAARAAGGFTFTADGVQVDKSEIMAHCHAMVALYSRGQVRSIKVDTGLTPFERDYYS